MRPADWFASMWSATLVRLRLPSREAWRPLTTLRADQVCAFCWRTIPAAAYSQRAAAWYDGERGVFECAACRDAATVAERAQIDASENQVDMFGVAGIDSRR